MELTMDNESKRYLPLNLQFFAGDGGQDDPTDDPQGGKQDQGGQDDPHTGDEPGNKGDKGDDKTVTMTQEEFDKIISDRLARERKKQEEKEQQLRDEAERKRLEEQGEFKELADSRQKEIERLQEQLDARDADLLKTKKTSLITGAGYSEDQVELLVKLVEGETEDEIKASIDSIKASIPPKPKHVDPSAGNGRKQTPSKKGGEDVGANAWERIKGKIRR